MEQWTYNRTYSGVPQGAGVSPVLANVYLHELDKFFLQLIWKFLKAGYMEQWTYNRTYSGVPQGAGVSPVLANVYLHELDKFMEEYAQKYKGDHSDSGR